LEESRGYREKERRDGEYGLGGWKEEKKYIVFIVFVCREI
jgi:hypothetical protein